MPTYDYVCGQCGHELELFQSITEAPKKKCPACGKNRLQRRIGPGAGILFKGSGFYQTDYRSSSYEAAAKSEKESPSGSGSGSSADSSTPKAEPKKPSGDSKSGGKGKKKAS